MNYQQAALAVLQAAAPQAKTAAAEHAMALLEMADPDDGFWRVEPVINLPDRPQRPARPCLAPPGQMPRRRLSSKAGRIALLHAVAHIEFNAIDLAFDMAARFAREIDQAGLAWRDFVRDWFMVGADEARHFNMVRDRLLILEADYGDLPAHDGLWEAANTTADHVLARLAIAPMVLEARGLDVTPAMIAKLKDAGDTASVDVLTVIYNDEINHVACGHRWFDTLCAQRRLEPQPTFQELVEQRFSGSLKPPFNVEARSKAGFPQDFYDF